MLTAATGKASSPRTPARNKGGKSAAMLPAVVIGEEAYSVFGENGDSIIEDLMRTDHQIMDIISENGNGTMETLLGSVFSPARVTGLSSPHVSHVLMSPAFASGSPRRSPRSFNALPWSPYPPSGGSIRRSVRITPARGAFARDNLEAAFDLDAVGTPSAGAPTAATTKRSKGRKKPSSKKALRMGAAASPDDFEDYVLAPLSPFTPATATTEREAPRGKAKLAFTSDSKKKSGKRGASGTKRGEYKCGKCGFFPKKEKHDCAAFKKKCLAEGIEIQTRVRKSGGKKKPKAKTAKAAKAGGVASTAAAPGMDLDAAPASATIA